MLSIVRMEVSAVTTVAFKVVDHTGVVLNGITTKLWVGTVQTGQYIYARNHGVAETADDKGIEFVHVTSPWMWIEAETPVGHIMIPIERAQRPERIEVTLTLPNMEVNNDSDPQNRRPYDLRLPAFGPDRDRDYDWAD